MLRFAGVLLTCGALAGYPVMSSAFGFCFNFSGGNKYRGGHFPGPPPAYVQRWRHPGPMLPYRMPSQQGCQENERHGLPTITGEPRSNGCPLGL